jgi:hypothetical protein
MWIALTIITLLVIGGVVLIANSGERDWHAEAEDASR